MIYPNIVLDLAKQSHFSAEQIFDAWTYSPEHLQGFVDAANQNPGTTPLYWAQLWSILSN